MPRYLHKCDNCDQTADEFRPASESSKLPICPGCGKPMPRDYSAELPGAQTEWAEPLRSVAAGIHPAEVAQAMKENPHHRYDPKTGDMLFNSPSHKKQCLKDIGMHERG